MPNQELPIDRTYFVKLKFHFGEIVYVRGRPELSRKVLSADRNGVMYLLDSWEEYGYWDLFRTSREASLNKPCEPIEVLEACAERIRILKEKRPPQRLIFQQLCDK